MALSTDKSENVRDLSQFPFEFTILFQFQLIYRRQGNKEGWVGRVKEPRGGGDQWGCRVTVLPFDS